MTVRVTQTEVEEIINTELSDLTPFIRAANVLVDKALTSSGLAEAQLFEIELWLSAHFVAIRDPVAKSEKIGDAQVDYWLGTVEGGKGLLMTPYGHTACVLDTTGTLMSFAKGSKKASLAAIDLELTS